MEMIKSKYVTPSIEVIVTDAVRLLNDSLPIFEEEEITDPTEIE